MKTKFKLTRGGIQYFDAGGQVLQPQATTVGTGGSAGLGITNSGSLFNPSNAGQAIYNPVGFTNSLGGTAQGLASAFTTQNGYQAGLAPTALSDYSGLIGQAAGQAGQGYGQFNQNLGQESNLANLLTAEGQGQGPNPALAQLQQQTGQNIASQAALAAGQRGASSNPGLIARQVAQQGAGIQQNAIGQAATQQANQELAAQQQAAGLEGNIGNQITGEQNANTGLFTGASGAQNTQNSGQIQNYNMAQGINSQVAQNNANAVNKTEGGLLNGAGSLLSLLAHGGEVKAPNAKTAQVPPKDRMHNQFYPQHLKSVKDLYHPHMADGGSVQVPNLMTPQDNSPATGSFLSSPQFLGFLQGLMSGGQGSNSNTNVPTTPVTGATSGAAAGSAIGLMACGGSVKDLKSGGKVPGKAKVKGDSYKNDVVDAKVSPGEIVIPRSVIQSEDPAGNAAKFVTQIINKHPGMDEEQDFKGALKKAISGRGKK